MAKSIDEAIALFASGKSPRECEKLTGIPKSTVDREAKKRGIIKGSVGHLINDKVRVESEIAALDGTFRDTINKEVSRQLEGMEFYATHARKVAKMGLVALSKDQTPANAKVTMETLKTGLVVEGLVPFYPNATTINNTNAQLNNEQINKIEWVNP